MAKSIRVSEGIYELAASAGDAVNRSLADQIEYWARLGASLDAAGVTTSQVIALLGGDGLALTERILAHVSSTQKGSGRRRYAGDPGIAARHAQLALDVTDGRRAPESLLMLPRGSAKDATFAARQKPARGTGW